MKNRKIKSIINGPKKKLNFTVLIMMLTPVLILSALFYVPFTHGQFAELDSQDEEIEIDVGENPETDDPQTSDPSADDNQLDDFGYIPKQWHVLPENPPAEHGTDKRNESENEKYLDKSIKTIFKSQELVNSEVKLRRSGRWQLENLVSRFVVGANGLIGLGILKGEKAIELWYRRRQNPNRATEANKLDNHKGINELSEKTGHDLNGSIFISPDMSAQDIQNQIGPVVTAVTSSGRIKNVKKFQANLWDRSKEFHAMVSEIDKFQSFTAWYVKGFRMELSVTAEGTVLPFLALGAEVRLRLEWYRIQPTPDPSLAAKENSPVEKSQLSPITRFVKGMSEDLAYLTDKNLRGTSYAPTFFRVGVGIGLSGNIVLVKAGALLSGHILFQRDLKNHGLADGKSSLTYAQSDSLGEDQDSYLFMEEEYKEGFVKSKTLEYAERNGIPFEIIKAKSHLMGKDLSRVVYKIGRDKFRKGLEKSTEMAKYFLARMNNKGRWELFRVRSGFEVSVSGTIGVVSLTGLAMTEIYIDKIKF